MSGVSRRGFIAGTGSLLGAAVLAGRAPAARAAVITSGERVPALPPTAAVIAGHMPRSSTPTV
ncbi:hypothetical protein AB0K48_47735, partial [Nonomuraea sp. NPDC055795]